uniref:putative serine protease K12H4.7 n=1 Tax=Styela clava TaxID=7725 RepID=UPI00193940C8|nr:putative serine protease K12H4.7 [Styela clava]
MRPKIIFVFLSVVFTLTSVSLSQADDSSNRYHAEYLKSKEIEANAENWIQQRLNHFDALDRRRWLQKYKKSDAFYKHGGPVVLYVGGESRIGKLWLNSSQLIMKTVREYGAMLFYLEHRYYGESKPTNDTSVRNLRFLSSQQALKDLVYFIQNMTEKHDGHLKKWILFGGSYPGALAVWARLKFPHLIYGVVAASPPLEAKLFFNEYLESVNDTLYKYGGSTCHSALGEANRQIASLMETGEGKEKLRKIFNLCNASDLNGNSMGLFYSIMNNQIENVVQYSRGNIIVDKPMYITLNKMCDILTNKSIGTEIYRLQKVIDIRNNSTECITTTFTEYTAYDRNTSWGEQSSSRVWLYQACSEFGWFQTVSRQPFQHVQESFPTALCLRLFGPELEEEDVVNGPAQTNLNYGGKKVADVVTHTVIFNGGVDPWHKVSYSKSNVRIDTEKLLSYDEEKKTISPFSNPDESNQLRKDEYFYNPFGFSSIFVAESSHAEVLSSDMQRDSIELRNSRTAILRLVSLWLGK